MEIFYNQKCVIGHYHCFHLEDSFPIVFLNTASFSVLAKGLQIEFLHPILQFNCEVSPLFHRHYPWWLCLSFVGACTHINIILNALPSTQGMYSFIHRIEIYDCCFEHFIRQEFCPKFPCPLYLILCFAKILILYFLCFLY